MIEGDDPWQRSGRGRKIAIPCNLHPPFSSLMIITWSGSLIALCSRRMDLPWSRSTMGRMHYSGFGGTERILSSLPSRCPSWAAGVSSNTDCGRGDADSDVFDAFEPSLFVLATAISQPVADRITVDAGYKAFANERNSKPEFRRLEGLKYYYGGDEHGIVIFKTDARPLQVGDKAQLIISHCDPTVNLYDYYHIVQDGRVKQLWPISARGCSQ